MELAEKVHRRYHWPTGRGAIGGGRSSLVRLFPLRLLGRYQRCPLTLAPSLLVHRRPGRPAAATTILNLNLAVAVTWQTRLAAVNQAQGYLVGRYASFAGGTVAGAIPPNGERVRIGIGLSGSSPSTPSLTRTSGKYREMPSRSLSGERSMAMEMARSILPPAEAEAAAPAIKPAPALQGEQSQPPVSGQVSGTVAGASATDGPAPPHRLTVVRLPGERGWSINRRELPISTVLGPLRRDQRSGGAKLALTGNFPRLVKDPGASRQEKAVDHEATNGAAPGLIPLGRLVHPAITSQAAGSQAREIGPELVHHLAGRPVPSQASVSASDKQAAPARFAMAVTDERRNPESGSQGRDIAPLPIDVNRLTDEVYRLLERRLVAERERRGR